MKICIPTADNRGLDAAAYGHFGSAPYYTIADTEQDEVESILNRGHRHRHGSCDPVEHIEMHNVDGVVCPGLGRRAFASLNRAGIDVYVSDRATVREILDEARQGRLKPLTADQACAGHGHGQDPQHGRHRHGGCGPGSR